MSKPIAKPKVAVIRECFLHGRYDAEECPACAAAIEEEAEVVTIPAAAPAVERRALCRCTHAEREHCKGGDTHFNPRLRVGQKARPADITVCSTRHCKETLCTCVEFVPAPAGEGAKQ